MKLKKCASCNVYTLNNACKKCGSRTKDAHYKFLDFGKKIDKRPKGSITG